MKSLAGVVQQLKKEHARAVNEVQRIAAALAAFGNAYGRRTGNSGGMSAAARARISAAQKARWAKVRAGGAQKKNVATMPIKRTISAASRKKIAAAQRARWAKIKAKNKIAA